MSTPTPAIFAGKRQPTIPPAPVRTGRVTVAMTIDPTEPGTPVRPGMVAEVVEVVHDGVVKSKHLEEGQRVRPYVNGQPRGGERIVRSKKSVQNGAFVQVQWASLHSPSEHAAAYRWFDESLVGTIVETIVRKPGFVTYHQES